MKIEIDLSFADKFKTLDGLVTHLFGLSIVAAKITPAEGEYGFYELSEV